jgi:hypothetical protein
LIDYLVDMDIEGGGEIAGAQHESEEREEPRDPPVSEDLGVSHFHFLIRQRSVRYG